MLESKSDWSRSPHESHSVKSAVDIDLQYQWWTHVPRRDDGAVHAVLSLLHPVRVIISSSSSVIGN